MADRDVEMADREADSDASTADQVASKTSRSTKPSLDSPFFARHSQSWTDVLPNTPHVDLFRQLDSASTSLGPIADWGPALRLYIAMVFADSRAANIYWGPEYRAFYNEEFALLLDGAHPNMMGKPLWVGLPTAWEGMSAKFKKAAAAAEAEEIDNIPFTLERHGVMEETYFVGQFLPLRGDSGEIEGFFNTAYETTAHVMHERRRAVIEGIASILPGSVDHTLGQAVELLHGNPNDIPMAMLYSYDELVTSSSDNLRLRGGVGIPDGHPCAPHRANLESGDTGIVPYLRRVDDSRAPLVLSQSDGSLQATGDLFEGIRWRGFGEASRHVIVLPLISGGRMLGFYVQGINPRRPYDDEMYMSIVDTVRQIEAKWVSSISAEEAKKREAMLESRLTDSQRRLQEMARSAPIGMFQITPDNEVEWCNDQWYEMTGFDRSKTHVQDFLQCIVPEDRERAFGDLELMQNGQPSLTNELRLVRRYIPPADEVHEGEDTSDVPAWILSSCVPVMENGKIKLIMGYSSDISRQKWAESVQARNASAAMLAKHRQEEFIDVTSHEMRNPLTAITQLADGIARSLSGIDGSTYTADAYRAIANDSVASAHTILACAAHQKRVIDDVLILSRLESEMLSITPVAEQPKTVVNNVVRMFDGEVSMNNITIEAVRDKSYNTLHVDHVLADTSRLTQILINLISNAIKFVEAQRSHIGSAVC